MPEIGPILLYDGVCGLCNASVRFVLKHDRRGLFRFATLQGAYAAEVLTRHGKDPSRLETVYVVLDPGLPTERLLRKSRAALYVAKGLGGVWGASRAFGLLPTPVLDVGYDLVARSRYFLFGKHDECPLPDPAQRSRFLDHGPVTSG